MGKRRLLKLNSGKYKIIQIYKKHLSNGRGFFDFSLNMQQVKSKENY